MARDPLGHIRISVSDFKKSHEFYRALFEKLDFQQVSEKGWTSREGLGIWIIQAVYPDHRYIFEAPGLHHLCLKAQSKEAVDQIYDFLIERSVPIVARPHAYPQYTPDYYAVFFADPDGIELEVAFY